ncbi:MAG TPA: FKBP-type peptidyl-prolyl cis-trans isomerase [Nocardioidaceae bacterium]|nr:FKBP-type peptidyl-prolyl cis-trans isomerase [Nocardioidaceae bacterium]
MPKLSRRLIVMVAVGLLLFGVAGCGSGADKGSGDGPSVDVGTPIKGLTVTGKVGTAPTVKVDAPLKVSKPETHVAVVGNGHPVQAGKTALLNLYLVDGTTGKKAASTYDSGFATQVTMDQQHMFKTLLEALVGKPRGSRVVFAAPVKDVYGSKGATQYGLKPKDSVVFITDIMSVPPTKIIDGPHGKQVTAPADAPKVIEKGGNVTGFDWSNTPKNPPKKLTVIPLVKGDGPVARDQSIVAFDYFGEVWHGKKAFDESYTKKPIPFGVGVHQLIPAWDKTIPGLHLGSRVLIIAPPEDAYGSQARPGIPANSTLVFVVDVVGVDD